MASADKDKLTADLSAYLDGELSPERARAVERFLAKSEDARQMLADLRVISRGLHDLPRTRAPQDLRDMVSRGAERQILLRERPPARKARVFQLFARISASAALIAACAFVGWTVLERISPPAPSGVGREIVAGEPAAADDDPAKAFARRLAPQETAQAEVAEAAAADADAEPPMIAMAEKPALPGYEARARGGRSAAAAPKEPFSPASEALAAKTEVVPRQDDETALAKEGTPVAAAAPVLDVAPAVNVVVTARNADEYDAALRTVALWQQEPRMTARRPAIDLAAERLSRGGRMAGTAVGARYEHASGAPTQRDFVLRVPPDQVGNVLLSLEQQAPQQVRVEMEFNVSDFSQVQRMVMPTDTAPRESYVQDVEAPPIPIEPSKASARLGAPARERTVAPAGPGKAEARRIAGRGGSRGRVLRSPPEPDMGVPAEAEEAEKRTRSAARPPPEAPDARAFLQLHSLGYVGDAAVADALDAQPAADKKAAPEEKKALADQRHPWVEDVAAGVHARLAPPATRHQVDVAERGWLDVDSASAAPPPAPVTLRVTLLPPPSPATTQPETEPAPARPPTETP